MVTEIVGIGTVAVAAGGYLGAKLFGSALSTMGDDINKLYVRGRDKIVDVATKKTPNPEDGKKVNLRAARDVLWNGAITDDEVCAEYFGGMLAASRSIDGKDDGVLNYVDTIKAMSAKQLELHYVVYAALQTLLRQEDSELNIAMGSALGKKRIVLAGLELQHRKLDYDRDLTVLHRQGLIGGYKYETYQEEALSLPYVELTPTIFGVLLFAVAHNKLDTWRSFPKEVYEPAGAIAGLAYMASDLEKLKAQARLQQQQQQQQQQDAG